MASRAAALLFLLLSWLHGAERAVGCDNVTALSVALDTLLAEYERAAPPAPAPVLVRLALDVRHAAVHDAASAVRLLADLRMSWVDKRLAWNATEWGCDSALVAAERLWLPDVELLNAAAGASAGAADAPLRARLTSDGRVASLARLDVTVPVALALDDWPSDVHTALFKFASRERTLDELDLAIQNLEYATVFESGAWEIVRVSGATSVFGRAGEGEVDAEGGGLGARRVATWAVGLRRRAPAHAVAARGVMAAATLLLLAAALMPPASRAPLCACASLTASLWLISALVRLPGGASTPRALALMCALSVCGACAAAGAALCARLARGPARPPPAWMRAWLATLSGVCKLAPLEGAESGADAGAGAGGAAWGAAAQLLDRLLLAALLLTLLVIVCLSV